MSRRPIAAPPMLFKILVLFGILAPVAAMHAQIDTNASASQGPPRGVLSHGGNDEEGPFRDHPELQERFEKGRAADRQRRIVDDANRLIALTAQYRQQVGAHGTPTDDDQKLLVQIEKLARDVKDRMRGM